MTAQSTQSGFNFGQTINDALARVGDLLTFDFLYDRGMIQTPAERQQQALATSDDLMGPRGLFSANNLLVGGILIVGVVAVIMMIKK